MHIDTVILDRDGVINLDSDQYIKNPEEFIIINNSLQALKNLYNHNIKTFIATNQSGINRKHYSLETFLNINKKLLDSVDNNKIISAIYYCTHTPEQDCCCRKPLPGMIESIIMHHKLNPLTTAFIGDSLRDLQAADKAGCKYKFLVKTGKGLITLEKYKDDFKDLLKSSNVFNDLYDCVNNIISKSSNS